MRFANVGSIDRIIRILVGLGLVAAALLTGYAPASAVGIAMIAVGAILVLTALVRFCPIYGIFRLRTAPKA